jgi:hypothetical protein
VRAPRGALRSAAALAVAIAAGCSSGDRTITIELAVGHETDALDRSPAVTRLDVTATDGVGAVTRASASPGGSFDLGSHSTSDILTIEATGWDAASVARVRGRSLSGVPIGDVASDVLPVFVQRTGEWARPPGALDHTHVRGVAGTVGERYLLVSGGASAASTSAPVAKRAVAAYDLLGLGGATMSALPRAPSSLVALSTGVVAIDDGGASLVDLDAGSTSSLVAPAGLASFADVAGGATVLGPSGTAYVVGGTRSGAATRAVLAVASDGSLSALALGTPRAGAAAAWIADVGLVVAGGSATGPGVEILSTGATKFASTAYGADATTGAAVATAAKGSFALVGGSVGGEAAPTRTFALDCGATCAGAEVKGASLPVATARTAAYALGGQRLVVVADEASAAGTTRAFVVDLGARTATELPLREPRAGATPAPAPNGTLVLLGGVHPDGTPALTVESFFPE